MRNTIDRGYSLPVTGYISGRRECEFIIDSLFFGGFCDSGIDAADVVVYTVWEKVASDMVVSCRIRGSVTVKCDRCLDPLLVEIDRKVLVTVRFSDEEIEDGGIERDEILLNSNESEVDLKQFFYDHICLSLPIRRVHKEGECNPDMVLKMRELGL